MHLVQPCCRIVRFLIKVHVMYLKHNLAGSNQELHSYYIFGEDETPGASLGKIEAFNGSNPVKIVSMENDRLVLFGRAVDGSGLNTPV
jgi:hypothetical protein